MSLKINKLTDEQVSQQSVYADKWTKIGLSTEPANRPEAERLLRAAYVAGGVKEPETILWADSPVAAVRKIKELSPALSTADVMGAAIYGQHDANWLGFYEYFYEQCSLTKVEKIKPLIDFAKVAGWAFVFDKLAVITERPSTIHITNEQLHCTNGPALMYPDGDSIYALNGVVMPAWLFTTPKDQISGEQIFGIKNVEQRGEAIKWYGLANMLELCKSKVLDSVDEYGYQLLEMDVGTDRPERYLKMNNPSTPEVHVEGVPPETETVEEALRARWPANLVDKYGYTKAVERA